VSAPTTPVPGRVASLQPFVDAGVLGWADVHLADVVARLQPDVDHPVLLAVAVAGRAPRLGHVGIELAAVAERLGLTDASDPATGPEGDELPWPGLAAWVDALDASPAVARPHEADAEPLRPLVWDGRRLYLQRYWQHELAVADDLLRRAEVSPTTDDETDAVLDRLFPLTPDGDRGQHDAARTALAGRISIVAGGPGTGKTRTIARLLAAAHQRADEQGRPLSVALAAPTGKAAARVTEAVRQAVAEAEAEGVLAGDVADRVRGTEATTLHRLLGSRGDGSFRHDRTDPLVHDLVVVDEVSMVALPLMARLLAAVRPTSRLVLVGDPDQLTSIEAGTVLADLVDPVARPHALGSGPTENAAGGGRLAPWITVLGRVHRFGAGSGIAALADAVRRGDGDAALALLRAPSSDLAWVRPDDLSSMAAIEATLIDAAVEQVAAAEEGDAPRALAAATRVKVLAATRRGPGGVGDWTNRIERGVGGNLPDLDLHRGWHVGRPVLVTVNDRVNRMSNGDVGVAVAGPDGHLAVALATGTDTPPRLIPPSRLREVEPWWAMTIHKSQGSEFPQVVVSLPLAGSPILTRELLYTAVTRAKGQVTVVASEEALRAAIARPVARASGLGPRLWPGLRTSG
jgi:exodeoxyribonuclease V alpha subunit